MTSNFDRWEKDPFFSAAEEVQESADRMESAYRRWIHAGKNDIESDTVREELRRDLHTALGTAKWQLEEFERAVRSSYDNCLVDDAVTRHRQFVVAIENQTSNVESSLRDSVMDEGKTTLPWVRLDEGERDELALFLVGTTADLDDMGPSASGKDGGDGNLMEMHGGKVLESMKNSGNLVEFGPLEMAEERLHGHRRIASAADIGTWKIAVADDEDLRRPPPRILSFSSLLRTMELKSKPKWPKNWPMNGFRKWKGGDRHQVADTEPLQSHQLSRGIDACYERSKNCLDSCDESYNKQLDGWLGAFQRQLQRSQYKIKYCRPVQITFWAVLVLCLIASQVVLPLA
ncbi:hypothetical protein MRB53_012610 [Persea americana]|uniref:Uncharacterized protein n=1 Tax=Persea americana TaxID=3435 RepID=A0ACC2LYR8_PERAE|nr:hypothetical protein MRB53_012610 [Persea americana]